MWNTLTSTEMLVMGAVCPETLNVMFTLPGSGMATGMAVTVGYDTAFAHGRTNRLKRTAKSGWKTDLKELREFRNIFYPLRIILLSDTFR